MKGLVSQLQGALAGSYTIERELSGGGKSQVLLATEMAGGQRVVMRVLPPGLTASLSVERFGREIQLAASLQHPHIVPVLAAGSASGLLYYTMPMVKGESLRARLIHQGELSVQQAMKILRDIAEALAFAHGRGILHCDINPDNILLSDEHALVTSFGVARGLNGALGTPAYMAPEQATADLQVDHRSDIYALGAVGYEILAGRPPFLGKSPQAVLAAQVNQLPDPLQNVRSSVPQALASLIMRCLEKSASARWQTAEEILHQLRAAGNH